MQDPVFSIEEPIPAGLDLIAQRRFRQVSLALEKCSEEFEEVEQRRERIERRAYGLRAEREALLDTLDRAKGGRR